jgi:hypothetical protein
MNRMNNKQIYQYLSELESNKFSSIYYLHNGLFRQKYGPFMEEKNGEKIYGYFQDDFFNFEIFKGNVVWSVFWFKLFLALVVISFLLVIVLGTYFDRLEFMGFGESIIFYVISICIIFIVLRTVYSMVKSIGSGRTIHYFNSDGSKYIKIDVTYSDVEM